MVNHRESLIIWRPEFVFVAQLLHRVQLSATPWMAALQAFLSFTMSWSLPKLMSIEMVMPSNQLIVCRPLILLPSVFPSITVFSNELGLYIKWPNDWSFNFNIGPSNEYLGLISSRIDGFDLLVLQGCSRIFCRTTVWKHQSFGMQASSWSNCHIRA